MADGNTPFVTRDSHLATKCSDTTFVHLHVHTEYSMLDGLTRVNALVAKAKELGMPAIALTDHGVMYGAYEFWKACKEAEIKPILGCEVYLAPGDRGSKTAEDGIKYYHLILLAKNLTGYHNLIKLVSLGHTEGFYYKPRIDKELLEKYSEGLVCTSACPQSPVGKHLMRGETEKALDWVKYLHGLFKEDFYLELQRHYDEDASEAGNGNKAKAMQEDEEDDGFSLQAEELINKQLIKWSKEFNIPLIATTDAHYLDAEDERTQEVLFAIKDGKRIDDPTRRRAYKNTYIKSYEEMQEKFKDVPEALENTKKLADSIEKYDIGYSRVQPLYPDTPEGKTSQEYLKELAYEGAKERYGEITPELEERLDMELDVIHSKGYDDYFLVIWDLMKYARDNGIIVGTRGSVGGSVVAYCLHIVDVDPISWELYFERFLNPERPSPPDIDMDIQDSRRDELIAYAEEKYGKESVCGIITFGKLKTRAAIRDVARVLGIDLSIADTLSKMVEVAFGKPKSLDWMMEHSAEFKSIVESDPKLQEMAEIVPKLDGQRRHVSTHACGHLITPKPITEYIPVQLESGTSEKVITQFEFGPLEYLDLMKFDFLGLANLSIIDYAIRLIKLRTGKDIDIYNIPLDDERTFKLFQDGNTTGIFQFESAGMKRYLKELHPETLEDLCFMAAAYRPGPMQFIQGYIDCKHGKKQVEYIIPELEPILKSTYGYLIYQEQVIRMAVDIAGYSMGQADILRRAMGKKVQEIMQKEKSIFVEGCVKNGYSEEIGNKLFSFIEEFANYGFNKAHSAVYAVIGYRTAYLKANYPQEFMCARLTAVMSSPDKLVVALEEARNLGIELLPPDINKSQPEFTPDGNNAIRYGLNGIKNVGHNVVGEIINEREKGGPFVSLDDFCYRVDSVNARTLDSLIKVGAMDAFGKRSALLQVYPVVMAARAKDAKSKLSGQLDMFGSPVEDGGVPEPVKSTPLPIVDEVTTAEKLQWEKELLGIYFTSHPLQELLDTFEAKGIRTFSRLELKEGSNVTALCVISKMKRITTKKGDAMAFVTLEDPSKAVEGVLFPRDYIKYLPVLKENQPVVIKGKANIRNDSLNIIVNEIIPANNDAESFEEVAEKNQVLPVEVRLMIHESATPNDLTNLRDLLLENPGETTVYLCVKSNGQSKSFKVRNTVSMDIIDNLIAKLPMVEKVEKYK